MSRRSLLLAAAGLSLSAGRLRADPAAPWRSAPAANHPDWRVRAAAWAVLAPNPHNRQPWLLELRRDGSARLLCDPARLLPVTDPSGRQIVIGLGAFAEMLRMAAAAERIAVEVLPFPEGVADALPDPRPVALFRRLDIPAAPDPLFPHAAARRSTKRPFDPARPVGEAAIARLADAAGSGFGATEAPGRVAALRDLSWSAWLVEAHDEAAHRESLDLMRFGRAAVERDPDGISLHGPGLDEAVAQRQLSRESLAGPGLPGFAAMVARYRDMLAATPAYVWLASPGGGLADAFAAGRDWLRLNLAATALGLGLHPVSQALQEYPAMRESFAAAHRLLGVATPGRVQMLGRLGHLPAGQDFPSPTPRWPAESRMLAG